MPIDRVSGLLTNKEAFLRVAEETVTSALDGDASADPLISIRISRSNTFMSSAKQRHGLLIQKTLADTLAASNRYHVFTEMLIPITQAAHDLVTSDNSDADLANIQLKSDSPTIRMASVDLTVIDTKRRWAGVYEVKRGNGETAWTKRKPKELEMKAIRMVLASYLKKLGHNVDYVTTAIVDYYGASGFPREIKLTREDLDAHFEMPVVTNIEAMTAALRNAMEVRLQTLLSTPTVRPAEPVAAAPIGTRNVAAAPQARPRGPGQWPLPRFGAGR
jgi:hypothetical protein